MKSTGKKQNYICFIIAQAFLLIIVELCGAKTIYVSPTGDDTTGETWENAFTTINLAYNASTNGDIIKVESGTYYESLKIRSQTVSIMGGYNGNNKKELADDLSSNGGMSIMDAGGLQSNVITAFVDSFFTRLILQNSKSRGFASRNITCRLERCKIQNNVEGGGIYIESSTIELTNCTISNNQCEREAGAISIGFDSSVLINSCTIENNEGVYCGGIGMGATKPLIIVNSIIRGNRTTGGDIEGGGVQIHGSTVEISNSLIYNNTTLYAPGAQISVRSGGLCQILSSTILGSQDDVYTDIEGENPYIVDNSILWGAPSILKAGAEVFNSCIQGGYTGMGNISDDPKFRDATNGDYRLLPDSPCIDTAGTSGPSDDLNGNPRPVDIAGIGRDATDAYDMGAYEVQLNEVPTPTPTQIPSQIDPGNTMWYQ